VGGAEISPVLLTRLVNDVGDNPDQLSILQHALNRTWNQWDWEGNGLLDLPHYQAIGTMAGGGATFGSRATRAGAGAGAGRAAVRSRAIWRSRRGEMPARNSASRRHWIPVRSGGGDSVESPSDRCSQTSRSFLCPR
jgi:hypothetical protein